MSISGNHGYSAGKFAIEIDGSFAGFLDAVEGGEVFGVVADEPATSSGLVRKHISTIKYEPIKIKIGVGMSKQFYDWISEMLAGTQAPRDGTIVFYDFQLRETQRLEWKSGLLTEVTFPALDASSKEAAKLTLTISPESTTLKPSSANGTAKLNNKKQKSPQVSNFSFVLDGLENASKRISKVDSITIKESTRDPQDRLVQPAVNVSNLLITLALIDAQPWLDWVEDFLTKGNNDDGDERFGSIQLLDSSLKDTLFTVKLQNVGIVRARRQRTDGASEVIARLEVELYCESVVFVPAADAIASEAPAAEASTAAPPATATARSVPLKPVTETLLSLLLERGGEDVQRSLANVLRTDSLASANSDLRAKLVAARLQSTSAAPPTGPSPKREDGIALGELWASERAAFGELEQVAQLEVGDWTALRLASEHTLIAQLQDASLIPAGADGAFELERSDFVEGVIAGAAKVLRAAAPHLKPSGGK